MASADSDFTNRRWLAGRPCVAVRSAAELGGRSGRVDTERGHGTGWPSMFTDRFGDAREFARTTGRRTVRRAFSVARARLQGSEVAMRWPRASLKAAYD